MDSISQIALGAAVGVATMGRRTAIWKAALWGAVAGTLPDLDVFIDHGDPVRNMVLHRAETHSLFWLTLFSLPLAALVARLHGQWALWRRWWLALWLVLVTHPLLDTMTVYGTQLALPFSDHPFGVGSIFIIDPLYTLPLLVGAGWALASRGSAGGLRANTLGLLLSTAYLAWGVGAQQHVERIARESLARQGIVAEQLLVTPAPLNTLLWRVVAMSGANYHEGFYSLFDAEPTVHFDPFDRGQSLAGELQNLDSVRRIAAFSHGFYKLEQAGAQLFISDLRMGQEPAYSFRFAVAERHSPLQALERPVQQGARIDLARGLPWLWRRMWGEPLPPPR
jgi:inner membrane protein